MRCILFLSLNKKLKKSSSKYYRYKKLKNNNERIMGKKQMKEIIQIYFK